MTEISYTQIQDVVLRDRAVKDYEQIYERRSPFIAFAYPQKIKIDNRLYQNMSSIQIACKTDHGCRIGENLEDWLALLEIAEDVAGRENKDGKDEMRFGLACFIDSDEKINKFNKQGFLYMSIGTGPGFLTDNRNSVDQMYAIDSWGEEVLKRALAQGLKPVWALSNYNFNSINSLTDIRINNPEFQKYISSLEIQESSVEHLYTD